MMCDKQCRKCRRRYGWHGDLTDCPPCPGCGAEPDRKGLAADQVMINAAKVWLAAREARRGAAPGADDGTTV